MSEISDIATGRICDALGISAKARGEDTSYIFLLAATRIGMLTSRQERDQKLAGLRLVWTPGGDVVH